MQVNLKYILFYRVEALVEAWYICLNIPRESVLCRGLLFWIQFIGRFYLLESDPSAILSLKVVNYSCHQALGYHMKYFQSGFAKHVIKFLMSC